MIITGTTLVSVSSRDKDIASKGTKIEVAKLVGKSYCRKGNKGRYTKYSI